MCVCLFLFPGLSASVLPATDQPGLPGQADLRNAADENDEVHGERHPHYLQLCQQPARRVPADEIIRSRHEI